jgi:thioesterase domain-containing protein
LCYRELAQQLERPVYGLQAAGLSGEQAPQNELEKMAASYVLAVRTVQPHGPYLLGGWSSGGLIAFEMARQLEDAGEIVERVLCIDTPAPHCSPDIDDTTSLLWFLQDLNLGVDPDLLRRDELQSATLADALGLLRRRQPMMGDQLEPGTLEPVLRVFRGILQAGLDYRPQPVRADIMVLKAGAGLVGEFAHHPALHRADWGWSAFTHGRVHCHASAADHYRILSQQYLPNLADIINQPT